jgi:RNA polymerase sigma-B factor
MDIVSAARHDLSRAQLSDLQHAYHDEGDLDARERLIEAYLPLVRALARPLRDRGEALEDLVQVGSIGLIKAIDRFDPDRGVDLATFAVPNILGEMRRHLRDRSALIRIPRRNQAASARLRYAQRRLIERLQRMPTPRELAAAAELDESEIAEARCADGARSPLRLSDDLEEPLGADEAFRPSEDRVALANGLRRLHWREREVVRCRYFADLSQLEIASRLGISQTQTSRLLASGLAKLRADLDANPDFSDSSRLNSWHGDSRRRHGRAA